MELVFVSELCHIPPKPWGNTVIACVEGVGGGNVNRAEQIQRRAVDAVIWGATLALIHSRRPDILERLTAAPELLL